MDTCYGISSTLPDQLYNIHEEAPEGFTKTTTGEECEKMVITEKQRRHSLFVVVLELLVSTPLYGNILVNSKH
jgi:hypothetical protein